MWFEIPTLDVPRAQAFYETALDCTRRLEALGPSQGAMFPYAGEGAGVGGTLMCGPTEPPPGAQGPPKR